MTSITSSWRYKFAALQRKVNSRAQPLRFGKPEINVSAAVHIVDSIVEAHGQLTTLPSLAPGEPINTILTRLVSTCCEIHAPEVITAVLSTAVVQELLPSLRQLCGESECHLETHWAEYIGNAATTSEARSRLKEFPYQQNYVDLTRLELAALHAATSTLPRRIAFIGSGPLPLSSFFMLDLLQQWLPSQPSNMGRLDEHVDNSPLSILNIDHSRAAIAASSLLISKLRPGRETDSGIDINDPESAVTTVTGEMKFLCEEAGMTDLKTFDTVFLAALVGQTQAEKEHLMLQVVSKMRPGATLVVRTSWGLRTCLYPEVDMTTEALSSRIRVCSVVHPYNEVVNSIIVTQVR
ncbi:Nicotianamine synthase [Microdochium bolleyi]|uniref:Nicotianamine synthase n=1 Tax=Microdochium bolleyi TaxID=196109 RepID=A0A136IXJ1_9PEZI|nr:Nicotianamine synthase [Microdochium bolleyi]